MQIETVTPDSPELTLTLNAKDCHTLHVLLLESKTDHLHPIAQVDVATWMRVMRFVAGGE